MLPAWELAQLQSDLAAVFDTAFTVKRETASQSGYGTSNLTPSTVDAGHKCLLTAPTQGMLAIVEARLADKFTYTMLCPVATVIKPTDNVFIGSDKYLVEHVNTRSNAACLEVLISLVR